jgi:hypothetical protein
MHLRRVYFATVILVVALVGVFLAKHPGKAPVAASPPLSIRTAQKAGPAWAYPDPSRTPGFTNPDITQASIEQTVCNPQWSTKSVRPPSSYTTRLKKEQMRELNLPGTAEDYEEDHFISLELGGNATDPRNLWPEPYYPSPGAREKDVVENYLRKQVCAGAMALEEAQRAITTDWYRVYLQIH